MALNDYSPRVIYIRLLGYMLPHWKMFTVSILTMVILAATQPAVSALLKPMLDGSFVHKDLAVVNATAILLVAIFFVRGVCGYLGAITMEHVAGHIVMTLRGAMHRKLIALPIQLIEDESPGSMISKFTYDATQITDAATNVVTVLVRDILTIVGLLGWMAYLDWRLTLVALIAVPIVIVIVRYFSRRLRLMSLHMQELMGEITHILTETIAGTKIIRLYEGQEQEQKRFKKSINAARHYRLKFISAASGTAPIAQFIISIALAIIIYAAARQSAADELTVGGFVSFFSAMVFLFSPIRRLTSINARLQQGIAAAMSVFRFVDEGSEQDKGEITLEHSRGCITLDRVSFCHSPTTKPAVDTVSFTIQTGELVALVGPSGSGKSTIANLLPRFYQPTEGEIRIDGIALRALTLKSLRANIAVVSQNIVLFDDTVAANVAYGAMFEDSEEKIIKALEAAQAKDFLAELPQGIHTRIGPDGNRLSGGQRQRLAIARAFFKNAPILVLDEATSSLDSETESAIQMVLETLRKGRTTLVIAHRLSTVEGADRIVVMSNGQVVESGTHQMLLEKNALYTKLYRLQLSAKS